MCIKTMNNTDLVTAMVETAKQLGEMAREAAERAGGGQVGARQNFVSECVQNWVAGDLRSSSPSVLIICLNTHSPATQ